MTVIPASANLGAHSSEVVPPAENKARTGFSAMASVMERTVKDFPFHWIVLPTDFSDATGTSSVTGKFRCSRTFNMV